MGFIIETFLKNTLSQSKNVEYMPHVMDNVNYTDNLQAVKALFTVIQEKGADTTLKDRIASGITERLFNNVIYPQENRQPQIRNNNNLDELERAKEILEFFQTILVDKKIQSNVQKALNKANVQINREKSFIESVPPATQQQNGQHLDANGAPFQEFRSFTSPQNNQYQPNRNKKLNNHRL